MRCSPKNPFRLAPIYLPLLLFSGAALGQANDTVARIGDKTLSVRQFETEAQALRQTGYKHIKELDQSAKRDLLDGIIARELLTLEGFRRGLDRDSAIAGEVEKTQRRVQLRELYEREAVQDSYSFTEEQLRTFFAEKQYDSEVFSQHIVCDTEDRARQVIAALDDGAPFESLVSANSVQHIQNRFGPGGWVGWFKIGELYDELKEPLGTMESGPVYPEPVKTHVGYHVFRLKARRPVDFAANREWIEEHLRIQTRANDMAAYVEQLRRTYHLVVHPEALAKLLGLKPATMTWEGEDETIFTWEGGRLTGRDYMDQVRQQRALHPAKLDSAGLYKEADNLAGRQIMMAEADRLKLAEDPQIRQLVEAKQRELMVKQLYRTETQNRARTFSDEEVRAYYEQNIDQFTRQDGKITDFSFIRQSIRTMLREQVNAQAMDALLAELRETYRDQIEVYPATLETAFSR